MFHLINMIQFGLINLAYKNFYKLYYFTDSFYRCWISSCVSKTPYSRSVDSND